MSAVKGLSKCLSNSIQFNFNKNLLNNIKINTRCITTSSKCQLFYEPDRRGGIPDPKGNKSFFEHVKEVKENLEYLKTEFALFQEECKEKFEDDHLFVGPGDMDKKWVFESEKDLEHWDWMSDKDYNEGHSECSLTMSPNGKGLFTGNLDNRVPKDGVNKYAGYCAMRTHKAMKSFGRLTAYDWTNYTHLELKVRGDGRTYLLNLGTPGYFDMSWFDTYSYPLYTRGGPHWQITRIPFSKFFWSYKGRIQDVQVPVDLTKINTLGLTMADNINGPFRLEIDYIGLYCHPTHTEEFAYELYKQPSKFYVRH